MLTTVSYRLNKRAFVNNTDIYLTIIGENPGKVAFSDSCLQQIKMQLHNATLAGANKNLTDTLRLLINHPAMFLKRVQDITSLHTTANDQINITPHTVAVSLMSGTKHRLPLTIRFNRNNDFLLCTEITGIDLLLMDVSRAFTYGKR